MHADAELFQVTVHDSNVYAERWAVELCSVEDASLECKGRGQASVADCEFANPSLPRELSRLAVGRECCNMSQMRIDAQETNKRPQADAVLLGLVELWTLARGQLQAQILSAQSVLRQVSQEPQR